MKKFLLFFAAPALLVGGLVFLSSNLTSPVGADEVAEELTFVGSESCNGSCHAHTDKFSDWEKSGHPYKFTVIADSMAPTYPAEAINFQSQYMDSLGDGSHTWDDIAGVIGGYGWKARFVGNDGHLVGTAGSAYSTGLGHNQMNFFDGEDHGWVNYHPGDVKIYNYGCFKCHTTGGDTTGTWLEGVDGLGTFTEGGVGCEGCHGPGSAHVMSPSKSNIDRVYEFAHQDNSHGGLKVGEVVQEPNAEGDDINFLCGTCHNRDYEDPINSSGGFIKHHEQWDEMSASKHGEIGLTCVSCHDPHKRVIWNGDGINKTCGSCHPDQLNTTNHNGAATCLDCHMPFAAKSGTKRGMSGYKGDVRSHLWKITPDTANMFTADGKWVRDDETRSASLSPAYACLGCHNDDPADGISEKTMETAVMGAKGMHVDATSINQAQNLTMGIYPNPSSGDTRINIYLPTTSLVSVNIINASGQIVYASTGEKYPQGSNVISWDGRSNTGESVSPGYYFVRVSAGNLTKVDKLVLMK